MKKVYTTPQVSVENFEVNEYVAVCWNIHCSRSNSSWGGSPTTSKSTIVSKYNALGFTNITSSNIPKAEGSDDNHRNVSGTCGSSGSHSISGTPSGSGIGGLKIVENSADLGSLPAYILGYQDKNGNGIVDTGDMVAWYTKTSTGTRYWYHYGTVQSQDSNRPLHS